MALPSMRLDASDIILITFVVFSFGEIVHSLPHPNCTVHYDVYLDCASNTLELPGNFDVTQIPRGITNIRLGKPLATLATPPTTTNTVHDNVDPIPVQNSLIHDAEFNDFGTVGSWAPFETFLSNIKGNLRRLAIVDCAVTELPATFLRGYYQLGELIVHRSMISSIHVNAFDTGGATGLFWVELRENPLEVFDWAVFASAEPWLRTINLLSQTVPMKVITNSINFTLPKLKFLFVRGTQIPFPPQNVLDTMHMDKMVEIRLLDNNFCASTTDPTTTCSCCEAKEFVTWVHAVNRTRGYDFLILEFHCGYTTTTSQDGKFTNKRWYITREEVVVPSVDQYQHCSPTSVQPIVSSTKPIVSSTTIQTGNTTSQYGGNSGSQMKLSLAVWLLAGLLAVCTSNLAVVS